MGIEELTCWKTSDGKLFENRNMAVVHETELNGWKDANAVYTSGGSVADALRAGGYKYNIDRILENVTNKTRLCIPHWQCSDVPGYTPHYFMLGWGMWVGGDVGAWSGPYGSEVSLNCLADYARDSRSLLGGT